MYVYVFFVWGFRFCFFFFNDTATTEIYTLSLHDALPISVKPTAEMFVPDKDVATASFTTFDGLTVDLRLLDRDNTHWVAVSAAGSGAAEAEAKEIDGKV